MKSVFKFAIFALGIAAIALSVLAIANHCRNGICCDYDDDYDFED